MLVGVSDRLEQNRLGGGLDLAGNLDPLGPVDDEIVADRPDPIEDLADGHRRRRVLDAAGSPERVAKLAEDVPELVVADAPLLGIELLVVGAEDEDEAEQALDHALVDLADKVDPLRQAPRGLALDRRLLDARRQRRELAERPHRLALVGGQLELAAAAVGEDDAEPPSPGGDGGAGDGRDPGEACIARRQLLLEPLRCLDDLVGGQGPLRDRGLVEGPLDTRQEAGIDAVAADGADDPQRGVVEIEPGPFHRREPADRLAEAVVELADLGARVDLRQKTDENVHRVGPKR